MSIKRYTLAQLQRMRAGRPLRTRPDAPERELDEAFWRDAKWVLPLSSAAETAAILADPELMAVLRASLKDIKAGRLLSHAEVKRRLEEKP